VQIGAACCGPRTTAHTLDLIELSCCDLVCRILISRSVFCCLLPI
jgi:hypothetical protein